MQANEFRVRIPIDQKLNILFQLTLCILDDTIL